MSHIAEIPIDDGARNGRFHGLRGANGTMHSGRWDAGTQAFVYSNDMPIGVPIVAYNARLPGNPPLERTACHG
jgi:hypothetical protein